MQNEERSRGKNLSAYLIQKQSKNNSDFLFKKDVALI